jgi:hypothetical protein
MHVHRLVVLQWTHIRIKNTDSMESNIKFWFKRVYCFAKILHLNQILLLKAYYWNKEWRGDCKKISNSLRISYPQKKVSFDIWLHLRHWTAGTFTQKKTKLLPKNKPIFSKKPIWYLQWSWNSFSTERIWCLSQTLLSLWNLPEKERFHLSQMQGPCQNICILAETYSWVQ